MPPDRAASAGDAGDATRRRFLADGVLIFFLSAVAFAQPLYDVLSRGAELFVARRSEPIDVLSLVAIVSVLVPGALLAVQAVLRLFGERARAAGHRVMTGALFAILLLPVLKRWGLPAAVVLTLAGVAGVAFGWGLPGSRWLRRRAVLIAASLIVIAVPLWLLSATPVRKVLRTGDATGPGAAALRTPVILVVLDELASTTLMNQDREIDAGLFPGFHALAAESTWYRNATTVAAFTTRVVPALLTGRYPEAGLLPTASDYPDNLFTLLGGRNPLIVEERNTRLCPQALCENAAGLEPYRQRMASLLSDVLILWGHIVLPEAIAEARLPPVTAAWHDFAIRRAEGSAAADGSPSPALDRVDAFTHFVRSLAPTSKPALHYVHATLPHHPWKFTPSGKNYAPLPARHLHGFSTRSWGADEWLAVQGFQRHVMQAMFTDKLIAEMLSRLKATELYDDALLILVADHGVSFRPGDARRHLTETNYPDVMPVPLFVKLPGQRRGSIDDHNVELIDVLPTIAEVQRFDVPWRIDGRPLGAAAQMPRAEKTVIVNKAGEKLRFSASFDEKYQALAWKLKWFGPSKDPLRLYRVTPDGRYRALIGRPIAGLRLAPTRWQGELDLPVLFENVDPESPATPCHVTGRIYSEPGSPPAYLAVAVNGSVEAITRTYREGSSRRFAAMIAEEALQPGRNDVALYAIQDRPAGTPLLSPVSTGSDAYWLETAEDGETEALHAADGRVFPVQDDKITGRARRIQARGAMLILRGSAVETATAKPPSHLLVFDRGRFVFASAVHGRRATTRFMLRVPKETFPDLAAAEIRVFALSDRGYASELRYAPRARKPASRPGARRRPR